MKKMFKILAIILIIFFACKVDVYADDIDYACKQLAQETGINFYGQYGIKLEEFGQGDNNFRIIMEDINLLQRTENVKKALKDLVFVVTTINGNTSSSANPNLIGKTITFGQTIENVVGEFDDNESMTIELYSTLKTIDPDCTGNAYASITVTQPGGESSSTNTEPFNFNDEELPEASASKELLSSKCLGAKGFFGVQAANMEETRFEAGSFEEKFCVMFDLSGGKSNSTTQSLKCDMSKYEYDNDYYVNKSYFYDQKDEETTDEGTYVMHYDFTRAKDVGKATCTRKCEEVVAVEYGPPVSSLGGVCFEYKVRVTSLVNCSTTGVQKPPESSKYAVCTPRPLCYHAGGGTYLQGGPSEDFDACIKSCDGGKYTDKCSKKCYKKVYGKSSSNKMFSGNFELSYADKLTAYSDIAAYENQDPEFNFEACASYVNVDPTNGIYQDNNDGCYYNLNTANIILWVGKQVNRTGKTRGLYHRLDYPAYSDHNIRALANHENDTIRVLDRNYGHEIYSAGRWYLYNWHKEYYLYGGYTVSRDDGFYRHNDGRDYYGNPYYCNDTCYWYDCGGDVYLNYGFAEKDKARNDEIYKKALASCEAAATCSESTAEVTMSVDYSVKQNGKSVPKTINFPYSETKESDSVVTDKISSRGLSESSDSFIDDSTRTNPPSLFVENSPLGCYKNTSNPSFYQFVISFPGSWESKKGDGFKYSPQNETDYIYHDKEFCIPDSAEDVNQDWDHFVTSKEKEKENKLSEDMNTPPYKECTGTCKGSYPGCNLPLSDVGEMTWNTFREKYGNDINYNIHANITNFGYLGWNFNIDCFYAQSHDAECSNGPSGTEEKNCEPCTKSSDTAYTIRTVDLKCLFPSTTNSCSSYDNSVLTTDRIHGYNWSDFAILNKESGQTNKYTSTPSYIVEQIQSKGYTIYSDENQLDYEFNIDPQLIKKVKKSDYKYGEFGSTYLNDIDPTYKDYRLQMYYSNAFRNSGIFADSVVHIPNSKLLVCNNMLGAINGESGSCEPTSR